MELFRKLFVQTTQTEDWKNLFQDQTRSETSNGESCFNLSYPKKLIVSIVIAAVGFVLCFMSTFFLLSPRQFAKFYTLGSVCLLGSTFFLVGPKKQLISMFDSSRRWISLIYIISIVATLYTALILQQRLITLLLVLLQIVSAVWYVFSYIPFAQTCLRASAQQILPI